MPRKPYIKLDFDWREDPKVMLYEDRYGKAALVDLVTMFILMADAGGSVSLDDPGQLLKAKRALGKKRDGDVVKVAEQMVECGLASKEGWESSRRVCSARSMRDAETAAKRRESAVAASEAAAEKRRKSASCNLAR